MDLRPRAIKFLDKHGYCTISTVNSEFATPQSTLVRYANDDLTLYIISAQERRKVANITRNPNVSIVVSGRSLLLPPSSLILSGDAQILEGDDKEAFRVYTSMRFPASWINSQAFRRAKKRSKVVFIKVRAKTITLNKFKSGFINSEVLDVS